MGKERIDILLVKNGFAQSRTQAQRLVMAGQVRVDGELVQKPSMTFKDDASIEVETGVRFVSRGGEKLFAAIEQFELSVDGRFCADVGASTGGFTDCLLQQGAARVYAIDVGKGILHWTLRQDERVIAMEATNARYLEQLPEPVSLVTIDASFISLRILLPVILKWFGDRQGQVVALIKPQFEVGRAEAARGKGVIRDPELHASVLSSVLQFAIDSGFEVSGLMRSPLLGPKGNTEFFTLLHFPPQKQNDVDTLIASVIPELNER